MHGALYNLSSRTFDVRHCGQVVHSPPTHTVIYTDALADRYRLYAGLPNRLQRRRIFVGHEHSKGICRDERIQWRTIFARICR
jgi:hypothetical protein